MQKYFVDHTSAQYYAAAGLSVGTHALERVLVLEKCVRWPLVFDPHHQAAPWLRTMMSAHEATRAQLSLEPLASADKYAGCVECSSSAGPGELLAALTQATEAGNVLLLRLEGGSTARALEQLLRPILLRPLVQSNRLAARYENVGSDADVHPRFRLIFLLHDPR